MSYLSILTVASEFSHAGKALRLCIIAASKNAGPQPCISLPTKPYFFFFAVFFTGFLAGAFFFAGTLAAFLGAAFLTALMAFFTVVFFCADLATALADAAAALAAF